VYVRFKPSFFALKCFDRDIKFGKINANMISFSDKCNFKCCFCSHSKHKLKNLKSQKYSKQEYEIEEIKSEIDKLFLISNAFKFTGGEPLLNVNIKEIMTYVKSKGGLILLDTNCSMVTKLSELISDNLVDILGVSLKGLNAQSACENSGINNPRICWDNVLYGIDIALKNKAVERVIVTNVLYNFFDSEKLYKEMCKFIDVFSKYKENTKLFSKLYFKFNNLFPNELNHNLLPIDRDMMKNGVNKLIKARPYLKNKLILINSKDGVTDYSKILFG